MTGTVTSSRAGDTQDARDGAIVFVAIQSGSRANGGLESFTQILAKVRGRRIVFTQLESDHTKRWRALGCEVELLDVPKSLDLGGLALLRYRAERLPALYATNRRVARAVADSGAKIVHCNDPGALWYAAFGARAAGARVVLNLRDTAPLGRGFGVRGRVWRHIASSIVVLSRQMRDELERELPPMTPLGHGADMTYVYSAVDLRRMTPLESDAMQEELRRGLGIPSSSYAIGYLATFNEKKNQLGLITELLPQLIQLVPRTKVYFVGDANTQERAYRERCREAVSRAGLEEHVEMVGFTDRPEDWYRAVDVVCLASRNEGLARAMIEGLACGTPVVSFDVSSAREILEGHECGAVVAQGDYPAMVAALAGLAADETRRRALGATGARVAHELFEPERSVAAYRDLYARLAASP